MNKEILTTTLSGIKENLKEGARLCEDARGNLNALMKNERRITFPDSFVTGDGDEALMDALEDHSEGVIFSPDDGAGLPSLGSIHEVRWDKENEITRVSGLVVGREVDGKLPRFDCPIDSVSNVDAVINFVLKFGDIK